MRKITKRISAVFMAMALTLTMVPAVAQAAVTAPKSVIVYQNSKGGSSYVSFGVDGLTSKQTVSKSSVKSSNKSVASPKSISVSQHNYKTEYYNGTKSDSSSSRNVNISFESKKAGTSTISYKVGSKTYQTKIRVEKYANPIKSLTMTGISGNLAGKFRNGNSASAKIASSKSTGKIKVTAASGWKIKSVDYYNAKTNRTYYVSSYSKPASSMTLYTGVITKGDSSYGGYLSVYLENTKTHGTQFIDLSL